MERRESVEVDKSARSAMLGRLAPDKPCTIFPISPLFVSGRSSQRKIRCSGRFPSTFTKSLQRLVRNSGWDCSGRSGENSAKPACPVVIRVIVQTCCAGTASFNRPIWLFCEPAPSDPSHEPHQQHDPPSEWVRRGKRSRTSAIAFSWICGRPTTVVATAGRRIICAASSGSITRATISTARRIVIRASGGVTLGSGRVFSTTSAWVFKFLARVWVDPGRVGTCLSHAVVVTIGCVPATYRSRIAGICHMLVFIAVGNVRPIRRAAALVT